MIIKIFVVTKDEYDLIADWTKYYGNIFGYENLTIIDNGSTHMDVLTYYEYAKKLGVNIIIDIGYEGNEQGKKFTKYMLLEKERNISDFVFGCDTDNFLFLTKSAVINKHDILDWFSSLPKDQNKFLIHSSTDSIINPDSPKYINNKYKHPIFDTETFVTSATVCSNFL